MNTEHLQSELFVLSMWWRIFYGSARLILGLVLLKMIDVQVSDILFKLTGSEVAEDPTDIIFTTLNSILTAHPVSITYFLSAYFIFWGIVEIFLSISLLRHKLWAFPVTLGLIGFFMTYVVYRYTHTHSPFLVGVFIVDAVIFWLIWGEYNKMKNRLLTKPSPTPSDQSKEVVT